MTFICSTLRLYGARTLRKSMQEMNEFTHIIGKILEESHNNFLILTNNVLSGNHEHLFRSMEMVVKTNFSVHLVTVGKNKSIILKTINSMLEETIINEQKHIAHIFIQIFKNRSQIPEGFKIHPKNRG